MARKRSTAAADARTVLVVDDQPDTLDSVRLLLEREGHRVLTAASGPESLELLGVERVHVALVDYLMPRMTGEELVGHIRGLDPSIQVILQTGYAGEKPPREMMRRLDIQGYHDKAEGPEKLLLWVDVAMKAHAQLENVTRVERLKSDLLTNVSHELRTPLNIMLGYSEMLIDGACGPQTPQSIEVLERMRRSAEALRDIVNDCLDMSRLAAGEIAVQLGRVSLESLREDVERAATGLLQDRPVSLRWELAGVPAVVAERSKLRIVLFNLLVTAAKATCNEVAILAEECGDRVLVAVQDDGPGAGERPQDTTFEPFVHEPTTGKGGSGLGLSIARELALLMGGDIEVASAPGAGRVFTLSLQRAALAES
ncbi:MAG TPA: hybrid sensor histidine kinase/response regulator [Candidatus Eisenbacteria bacterium]|nr:hybrid sensor histidine kinase/response regulator [Candidatus Eisenbacteria bacterium]